MAVLDQEYLTTDEMAERYRTVPSVIRYWRHSGYGPEGIKVGKRVLYPREQVEAFDRQLRERGNAGSVR
jgi:hypothetical protein